MLALVNKEFVLYDTELNPTEITEDSELITLDELKEKYANLPLISASDFLAFAIAKKKPKYNFTYFSLTIEYYRIQEKISSLSSNQRKDIERIYNELQSIQSSSSDSNTDS